MATYIMLSHYTQQGVQKVKDSPKRVVAARKAFKSLGVDLKAWYALMGRYDTLAIIEAPDAETAGRAALALASLGNVSTETIRAFTEDEFKKLVAGLP